MARNFDNNTTKQPINHPAKQRINPKRGGGTARWRNCAAAQLDRDRSKGGIAPKGIAPRGDSMGIAQKVSMGIASKVSAGIAPKGDRCCSCGWGALQRGIAPKVTLLQLSAGRAGRTRPRTRVCEVGAGDRLLIVTDGPYICPDPLRGHTAHPGHVHPVAEKIAEWQGKPVGDWLPCAAAPLRSTARGLPRLHTEPRGTGEEASKAGLPCRRALGGLLQRRFGADTLSLPVRAKEGSFLILPCSRPKHLGNPPGQPLGEGTAAADGAPDASGVAKKLSTPGPAPSDFTRWRTSLCSRLETPRPHGTSEGDKAKSLATNY